MDDTITDKDGQTVARYTYDAWGVPAIVQDVTEDAIATVNPYRYRSYYYDTETGMYYLQSRYYDPVTGRFINADDVSYISSAENIKYHCLYSYCINDCVNESDYTGFAIIKVVGLGLQLELNISVFTVGMELVWYISSSIRKGRAWYIPYVYYYGGAAGSADLTKLISQIIKKPAFLLNPKKLTKLSASISVFAIFGYPGKFNKPEDYEGPFNSVSLTLWNVKGYVSWSKSCSVVGVGVSTSKFEASTGVTYYKLSSNLFKGTSKLYSSVSKKGKTIKKK